MTKIVLIFWVLNGADITDPQTIGDDTIGFRTMSECFTAAESLTEPNPEDTTQGFAVIARCLEVPR